MQSKNIKIDNFEIYTENFGEKSNPAFLLISGAGAPARFWTDSFCKSLSDKGYFIIRFDNRDTGLSSSFDLKKRPYSVSDLADDAIKILDAYKIKKANLVGHSMGGYIVQDIALRYPYRINFLTIISAGPIADIKGVDLKLNSTEQKKINDCWYEILSNKPTQNFDESIDGFMKIWKYFNGDFELDVDLAKNFTRDIYFRSNHKIGMVKNHVQIMEKLFKEMSEKTGNLVLIKTPTLIIHGAKDSLVMSRVAKEMSKVIKNSKFVLIDKMGHMIFNKDLEKKILNEIINFVEN